MATTIKAEASADKVIAASAAFIEALRNATGMNEMPTQQQLLLLHLYRYGEISQSELPKYTGVQGASNARHLFALGAGGPGWVENYEDPDNRKRKIARITTKGRRLLEKCAAEVAHMF